MRQERLRKSDHLNPLARHPRARAGGARRRLPHRADPLLHADRRRLRREHPDADGRARRWRAAPRSAGRHGAGARRRRRTRAAIREARTRRRKARDRAEPGDLRGAARAVGRHEAGPAAVRPRSLGAVLRAAASRPDVELVRHRPSLTDADPLLRHRPDRARHDGGSVHVAAVAEGLAALGHDVHVLVIAGRRRRSRRGR